MSLPEVTSRNEWLAARTELLAREKELTRARDALTADRRRLPMVEIDKPYIFEGPDGTMSLLDLFEGRRQLILHHFMWTYDEDGNPREQGCPSCSGQADNIPHLAHLHNLDTTVAAASRAPFTLIDGFKARMGWTFPWYSSAGSDFNYDFHVTVDPSVAPVEHNYRTAQEWEGRGLTLAPGDYPGISTFLRDGDRVFHTYSTFARGLEQTGGTHYYLDLTALGRQESWEEPTGRSTGAARASDPGVRYHDEYGRPPS